MKQNQVALAALTVVGRAPSIVEGRIQLTQFILTLNDHECAFLIYALAEMLALKMMETCESKEQWWAALQKAGELLAIAIEDLERPADG